MIAKERILVVIFVLMLNVPDFAAAQLCQRLNKTLFPHCSKYYNYTISLAKEQNITQANYGFGDFFAHHIAEITPNCSKAMELILCTWYALPSCVEGIKRPVLPCQKVCFQIINKCGQNVEADGLEWMINICSLLPPDTNDPKQCIDLPEFTRGFTDTGPPTRSCYKLNVSQCMGLGYEYTTSTPAMQNDEITSRLLRYHFGNGSDVCSSNRIVSRIVCSEYVPPCFVDDPHGFYRACASHCDQIPANCTHMLSKQFGKSWSVDFCRNLGTDAKGGGICKVSSWRHTHFWPKPTPEVAHSKDRPIPPEVIAAIVLAVVITAVVTVAVILIWRRYYTNAGFIYHRYGLSPGENTADLEL